MRVTNINGTSQNTCGCGSWLYHWRNFSGQPVPTYCPERNCLRAPTVGAHIQKDGSTDRGWYIVPLCDEHNRQTFASLDIGDHVPLVSANVSQTCGR